MLLMFKTTKLIHPGRQIQTMCQKPHIHSQNPWRLIDAHKVPFMSVCDSQGWTFSDCLEGDASLQNLA